MYYDTILIKKTLSDDIRNQALRINSFASTETSGCERAEAKVDFKMRQPWRSEGHSKDLRLINSRSLIRVGKAHISIALFVPTKHSRAPSKPSHAMTWVSTSSLNFHEDLETIAFRLVDYLFFRLFAHTHAHTNLGYFYRCLLCTSERERFAFRLRVCRKNSFVLIHEPSTKKNRRMRREWAELAQKQTEKKSKGRAWMRKNKQRRFFDGNGRNDQMHKCKEKSLSVPFLSSKAGDIGERHSNGWSRAHFDVASHLRSLLGFVLVQQTIHRCTKSDTQR